MTSPLRIPYRPITDRPRAHPGVLFWQGSQILDWYVAETGRHPDTP
ncbi:MAG TPA: hypothetical protein VHF87_16090 [Methylomirabilota bacterium]|nr:hypothetical protein [Methylomirabilota bacterium]